MIVPAHFAVSGVRAALCGLTIALYLVACRENTAGNEVHLQDNPTGASKDESLCLQLFSPRSEVLLGEPVSLIVSLTNCSSETVSERDLLAPEFGLLSVWVQRPGEAKELLYSPPVRRDGRGKRAVKLPPGESLHAELPVYFARGGWVLDREGIYRVRVEYPVGKSYIESEPVELRVSSTRDKQQLTAARAFMQPNASRFYFLTGGDAKGQAELEQITDAFPDTVWASYSRLAIDLNQVLSSDSVARKASCQLLRESISSTLTEIPDIVTASHGYQVLVDCLRDSGLHEAAEYAKNRYYRQFPQAIDVRTLQIEDPKKGSGS